MEPVAVKALQPHGYFHQGPPVRGPGSPEEPRFRSRRHRDNRARHRRVHRRSSASSTPCCCGRCRTRTLTAWSYVWGELRDAERQRLAVLAAATSAICGCSRRRFSRISRASSRPAGRRSRGGGGDAEQIRVSGDDARMSSASSARASLIGRDFIDDDATPQPEPPQPADGAQAGIPPAQQPAGDRDPQPRPVAAPLRRRSGSRRADGRSRQRPRADRRRARARTSSCCFRRASNVERVPDMWTVAALQLRNARTGTMSCSASSDGLKPGVTLEQAQAAGRSVAADLRQHFPIKAAPACTSTSCRCTTTSSATCVRRSSR